MKKFVMIDFIFTIPSNFMKIGSKLYYVRQRQHASVREIEIVQKNAINKNKALILCMN